MRKKDKACFKASFTVEAALIMPVVLGVVLLLLEAGLILHDKAVISAILYETVGKTEAALNGMDEEGYDFAALSRKRLFFNSSAEALAEAESFIKKSAGKALLFSGLEEVSVTKNLTGINIKVRIKYRRVPPLLSKMAEPVFYAKRSLFDREAKTRLTTIVLDFFEGLDLFSAD